MTQPAAGTNSRSASNSNRAKDRLDLLPMAFRRKMLWHARIRQWGVVVGACAAISIAFCLHQYYQCRFLRDGLEVRRLRAAPLETVQAQIIQLGKRLAQLRSEQELRAELESEQVAFHLLATVSRSAATCVDGVQVQQFTFARNRTTVSPPAVSAEGQSGQGAPPPPTEIETLVMTVKGIGADNLMVSRFVVALRESQVFQKVDLKSSTGSAGQVRGIRSFVVECTL